MMRIARFIVLAVAFTAPPVLAAEQPAPQQNGAQEGMTTPSKDQRSLTPPQATNEQNRMASSSCSCQHDNKTQSREQPQLDFGETARWPVN